MALPDWPYRLILRLPKYKPASLKIGSETLSQAFHVLYDPRVPPRIRLDLSGNTLL